MKKNNKAITLIALVITIVVLIILAAVAINLSLGNNGIFNRAKTGKEMYQNAEEYDNTEISKVTNQIDNYIGGNRNLTLVNYSTEAQDTGLKWTDGSPIYQITIFTTTPSSADTDMKVGQINNLKTCISIEGNTITPNGQNNPVNWFFATNVYLSTYVESSSGAIRQRCSSGYINQQEQITVRYITK